MHDRSEWKRGPTGAVTIGRRTYNNLVEFTRPCATCGETFAIHVTTKIANGLADSNSFGLRNCPKHRRNRSMEMNEEEATTLRTTNITMREELAGLYATIAELRAQLAKYELPAAMQQVACEPVQNTTDSKSENVPSSDLTFPWRVD